MNPSSFPDSAEQNQYKNLRFKLKGEGRYVMWVSKISGLKRTFEVIKHRSGSDSDMVRKSPGKTTFESITLERGITHDSEFEK